MSQPASKLLFWSAVLTDEMCYGLCGIESFHIVGILISNEPYLMQAFGCVKKADAIVQSATDRYNDSYLTECRVQLSRKFAQIGQCKKRL